MTNWMPGSKVTLESENYLIRSLVQKDATPEYISWWNDEDVQGPLGFKPRGWTEQRAKQHISNFDNRKRFHLGIFPKGESLPIGFFAIFVEGEIRATTNVVIGNKEYWGKGVVKEVRTCALDFIFQQLGMKKVSGKVNSNNYPSIFNYKALNFKTEGVLRKQTRGSEGQLLDEICFGLLKEEWEAYTSGGSQ
jgi:ribosomal-protein-alanine N-acetyltransferase